MSSQKSTIAKYFTESIMVDCLVHRYGNSHTVTPQYKWNNGRVDVFVESASPPELNFGVEFDGFQHYTKTSQCIKDILRDEEFKEKGFGLVRWPYWIQPTPETAEHFFVDKKSLQKIESHDAYRDIMLHPQGFISKSSSCVLPADFCSMGLTRFKMELLALPTHISMEVIANLKIRATADVVAEHSLFILNDVINVIMTK